MAASIAAPRCGGQCSSTALSEATEVCEDPCDSPEWRVGHGSARGVVRAGPDRRLVPRRYRLLQGPVGAKRDRRAAAAPRSAGLPASTAPASVPFVAPPVVTEPAAEPPPFAAEAGGAARRGPAAPGHRGAADRPLGRLAGRRRPGARRRLPGPLRGRRRACSVPHPAASWPRLLGLALIAAAEWLRRREASAARHHRSGRRRRSPPVASRCCSVPPMARACSTNWCRRRPASCCWPPPR